MTALNPYTISRNIRHNNMRNLKQYYRWLFISLEQVCKRSVLGHIKTNKKRVHHGFSHKLKLKKCPCFSEQAYPKSMAQGTQYCHSLRGKHCNYHSFHNKTRGPRAENNCVHLSDHYIVTTYLALIWK